MDFVEKACVMTAADMNRVLARMATQIVENNPDLSNVMLVGIRRRGVPLAERLAQKIKEMDSVDVATGALDITLYRDDLSTVGERPVVNRTGSLTICETSCVSLWEWLIRCTLVGRPAIWLPVSPRTPAAHGRSPRTPPRTGSWTRTRRRHRP